MADVEIYKGLTQLEYQQNIVLHKDFNPIEKDWERIFQWVMSEGESVKYWNEHNQSVESIASLWKNHVLTVLIEIIQLDVDTCKTELIEASKCNYGNPPVDLKGKFEVWKTRLQAYLTLQMSVGKDVKKSPAMQVAVSIHEQLDSVIIKAEETLEGKFNETNANYDCLKVVSNIKENRQSYFQLIENSGDVDPGLALLLIFVHNYCSVIGTFNQTFLSLPEFYYNKILLGHIRDTEQDKAFLLIYPSTSLQTFYLSANTEFLAKKKEDGTDLVYYTEKEELISGMKMKEAFSVFSINNVCGGGIDCGKHFYKRKIGINKSTILSNPFAVNDNCIDYDYGWMIESMLFVLREGERTIDICFVKEVKKSGESQQLPDGFVVYLSCETGWVKAAVEVTDNIEKLLFKIKIPKSEVALCGCSAALHQMSSEYPIVRILCENNNYSPYDWVKSINFKDLKVGVVAEYIHDFKLYNDFGEIDSTTPFYPFGSQGSLGSWFRFENSELSLKTSKLEKLEIAGTWIKIPDEGYKKIYADWELGEPAITSKSFKLEIAAKEGDSWKNIEPEKDLFELEESGNDKIKSKLQLVCKLPDDHKIDNIQSYRIMLSKPSIGFGTEKYREVFAKSVVNKEITKWPCQPLVPQISDISLSYTASASLIDSGNNNSGLIQISRISGLSEYEFNPISVSSTKSLRFIEEESDKHLLYFGISNTDNKKSIRMYFDVVFIKENFYAEDLINENDYPSLEWAYILEGKWTVLESKYILLDDTLGLTKPGYVEIEFGQNIGRKSVDKHGVFWLKAEVIGKVEYCLPIRGIYMDYIPVVARNGDGKSIPSGTIRQLKMKNEKVENITQPFASFNGRIEESKEHSLARHSSRMANRHRSVTIRDYEQIVLEKFPEILKVCCLPVETESGPSLIRVVVFSYMGNDTYPVTAPWKLMEIKKYLSGFISPFVDFKVVNPTYQKVKIEFTATVKNEVVENGEATRKVIYLINQYFLPWIANSQLPDLGRCYTLKELYTILVNEKDIVKVLTLEIDKYSLDDILQNDVKLYADKPWCVIVPKEITIELLLSNGGIGKSKIEYNFIIG